MAGFAQAQIPPFPLVNFKIEEGVIAKPLTATSDALRGQAIVLDRNLSSCVLCHVVPDPLNRPMGNIAPPLMGVGARLSIGQMRLRMVDSTKINPQSIMPAYYRIDDLHQVAPAWRGRSILDAQQIEDVVAYLLTLKEASR
ncbi:MAG: sulfur oxidation c-type cytochrome SoxX [Burkholderiales bacterium]